MSHTVPPIDLPDTGCAPRHASRGARRASAPGRSSDARWAGPPERRAFAFSVISPGVIEGVLIPYGVPIPIGGVFTEVWEPHCLLLNNIRVNIRHDWRRPFSGFGRGLRARDADDAMRAVLTLKDEPEARPRPAPGRDGARSRRSAPSSASWTGNGRRRTCASSARRCSRVWPWWTAPSTGARSSRRSARV